jgi:starch-binding outer membrane protein, SusD/RagB family
MKLKYLIYTFIAAGLTMGMGCKKWLDVSPKTQVRERDLFETEDGFKDALIGTYQLLSGKNAYGQNLTMGFADALAQRYNTLSTSHIFYATARYQYTNAAVKTYIKDSWGALYAGVANVNNILEQIDSKKTVFSGNNYNIVKGEALALRALLHFDALRLFGAAPIVNANKPSIPYVTTFGKEVYPLLTVNEVINNCLTDLNAATALLGVNKTIRTVYNDDPFLSYTRNHMNYWAVKGLQARVHLYKGDKTAALSTALEVIDEGSAQFPFVTPAAAAAVNNRDRAYATELLFSIYTYKLADYAKDYFKTEAANGIPLLYTATSDLNTLYETANGGGSDIRYLYWFNSYGSAYSATKYWQDDYSEQESTAQLKGLIPVIRLSEMYYIAAECATTPAEGVAYLNVVRNKRGIPTLSTAISAAVLEAEILKEYKKETYAEGQLFYYFKRKNTTRVNGSNINMNDGTWILPIPDDEVEFANRF